MGENVVIDKDILGWAAIHERELLNHFRRIFRVGGDPELPQRSFDERVAAFCKQKNCDLLTGDSRAHVHFFEAGIRTVRITKYTWWTEGDRPIYLIQIVD